MNGFDKKPHDVSISVIIPAFNEKENVEKIAKKILEQPLNIKIIFVEDNSSDGTRDAIKHLMIIHAGKIFGIFRPTKLGIGSAYVEGFNFAINSLKSDLVFSMDGDLSHDPLYLVDFIKIVNEGYDVVVGSRYMQGGSIVNWNFSRRIISRGANLLAKVVLGIPVHDVTTGYRCYKRSVLETINLNEIKSTGYSFLEDILFKCKQKGFRIGETPITFVDRIHGTSKLSRTEIFKFFLTLARLRFT